MSGPVQKARNRPFDPQTLRPNTLIVGQAGRYVLKREIGAGGFGRVFSAVPYPLNGSRTSPPVRYAIKFGRPVEDSQFAEVDAWLRHETATLAALPPHPAFPRLIDTGALSNGAPFLVMEFIDGHDLSSLIEEKRPLHLLEMIRIMRRLCLALLHLQKHHLPHLDIKPSNIMLASPQRGNRSDSPLREVKVVDFGSCGLFHHLGRLGFTPSYASPEARQYEADYLNGLPADKAPINGKADLFSLGVVFGGILKSVPIFEASLLPPESRRWLADIALSMINENPAHRPGNHTLHLEFGLFAEAHPGLLHCSETLTPEVIVPAPPSSKDAITINNRPAVSA